MAARAGPADTATYEVASPARAELEALTSRAMRLYHNGDVTGAVRAFERAHAKVEKHFSGDDRIIVQSLNNLALIYDVSGAPARSEALYRRAIGIAESNGDDTTPAQLAQLRNNLAAVVLQQCRIGDAARLYRQALKLSERSLGGDHVDTRMMRANVERLERYLGTTIAVRTVHDHTRDITRLLRRCVG